MTQEQQDFEKKYHYKVIKPLGNYYKFPIKEYIVTAALLNWENDETTFAIKALDYNPENKHWITIKIGKDEFEKCMADFEIIKDGYEEYVKPIIIDEVLTSWKGQEEGYWIGRYSSYYFEKNRGNHRIPVVDMKRGVCVGMDEYMFIYKSVYDLDKPSCYIITIPTFQYAQEVEEYVKPFREDVLNNKVAYGMNQRLMNENK